MTRIEAAKVALERIRLEMNAQRPANPKDVELLMGYLDEAEKVDLVVLGVIDLLSQSRNAFRSKQVERARKMLEGLLTLGSE